MSRGFCDFFRKGYETMKERIKSLCKSHGISMNKLEETLGFGKGYISKLGSSTPNTAKIKQIADYFNVTVDYLMTGEEKKDDPYAITSKDERDIARDLENLRGKLMNGADGPLSYEGEPIPEEDTELLLGQIELMMRRLKPINKEKYNPNKNKK